MAKNWEAFINIASYVVKYNEKYTFIIAGEGPLRNKLSRMIREYSLLSNVKLIGYVDDMESLYLTGNLFLSTSRYEGLPYSYLEAYKFGLPMIVPAIQGVDFFQNVLGSECIPYSNCKLIGEKILSWEDYNNRKFPMITKKIRMDNFIFKHIDLYQKLLEF